MFCCLCCQISSSLGLSLFFSLLSRHSVFTSSRAYSLARASLSRRFPVILFLAANPVRSVYGVRPAFWAYAPTSPKTDTCSPSRLPASVAPPPHLHSHRSLPWSRLARFVVHGGDTCAVMQITSSAACTLSCVPSRPPGRSLALQSRCHLVVSCPQSTHAPATACVYFPFLERFI